MKLVLASGSPRRRKFLADLGVEFEVMPSDAAEVFDKTLPLEEAIIALAEAKAENVAARAGEAAVLAADSVVVFEGEVIGKPKDAADAARILRMLSGKKHEVMTGYVFLGGKKYRGCAVSEVEFNDLDEKFIADYVATGSPLDKAGAYGIQDGDIVRAYRGSYTNIIGLPMERVTEILRAEGFLPEGD